ncbi:MAG: hypothetical protein ACE5I1_08925, partial [bacterium]
MMALIRWEMAPPSNDKRLLRSLILKSFAVFIVFAQPRASCFISERSRFQEINALTLLLITG